MAMRCRNNYQNNFPYLVHWHLMLWTIADFKCTAIKCTRHNVRKVATIQRCASDVPSCVSYRVHITDIISRYPKKCACIKTVLMVITVRVFVGRRKCHSWLSKQFFIYYIFVVYIIFELLYVRIVLDIINYNNVIFVFNVNRNIQNLWCIHIFSKRFRI